MITRNGAVERSKKIWEIPSALPRGRRKRDESGDVTRVSMSIAEIPNRELMDTF